MRIFAYFPQYLFWDVGPENCRTSSVKKSSGGSAKSPYKPRLQFYMGIYRLNLKNVHFSPVFCVFDPLDFEIRAKNTRKTQMFSILRCSLKMPSSSLVFSQGPF